MNPGMFRAKRKTTPRSVRTASKATALLMAAALVAVTFPIVPRGIEAAAFAAGPRDVDAITDWHLSRRSKDDYVSEIRAALAADDADLADSLRELAARRGVALPPALVAEIDAAVEASGARMAGEAWDGFVSGNAESEPALAGAIAADLTGYGDIRDLYSEAGKYVSGEEIDNTPVALAAVGLTLTVATVFTLGATTPEKAGVSTLKVVSRMGRLSRPLRRQVMTLAREAVDPAALRAVGTSLRSLDVGAMRLAARRVVRPAPAAKLKQLGSDVATLGSNAGYRGTLQALAKADDAADISRMARLSQRFGKATRGALVMLGNATLTLATIAGVVFSWSVSALFWILAAILIVVRSSVLMLRLGFGALAFGVRTLRPA